MDRIAKQLTVLQIFRNKIYIMQKKYNIKGSSEVQSFHYSQTLVSQKIHNSTILLDIY